MEKDWTEQIALQRTHLPLCLSLLISKVGILQVPPYRVAILKEMVHLTCLVWWPGMQQELDEW